MLERVPAQWKVIQIVREKMTCRRCEAITQPPAPSHPIARGRAGPQLLADVLFGKYGAHLPLNRQSDIYAREGVDLDVSTLADWVGACAATLMPLRDAIEAHVHAAERIHVDDTTVPVLAKNKCRTGRLWGHVRDDRPFGGKAAPAVVLYYSPTREGEHPQRQLAKYTGIMQVDAYSGYNALYVRGPPAWSDHRGGVLGAWAAQAVRAGALEEDADRDRGGAAHRRAVRHRARDQRSDAGSTARSTGRAIKAAGRGAGALAAR